jgi:hypothetical protein
LDVLLSGRISNDDTNAQDREKNLPIHRMLLAKKNLGFQTYDEHQKQRTCQALVKRILASMKVRLAEKPENITVQAMTSVVRLTFIVVA